MQNYVVIYFEKPWINVGGILLELEEAFSASLIEDVLPEKITASSVDMIMWDASKADQTGFYLSNGATVLVDINEENYNKWIKPYVDLWQEKKDQLDQEQAEIEAERNKFENRQARALTQLNEDFETVKNRAHLKSSLGFTIDANSTAKENVQGLIEEVGYSTVQFCDYYNQFHELNKSQLETLKSEINQNGQALYAQKWQYRTAIEQCVDNEGLDQVVAGIEFTYMDFTQTGDTGETVTE